MTSRPLSSRPLTTGRRSPTTLTHSEIRASGEPGAVHEAHPLGLARALVCAIVGYDPAGIQYDTERYVGRSKKLNTTKLGALEPDFAFTPVEVGLARTVERFLTDVHG